MTEEQAKSEAARLLLSGDGVQESFSRYLKDNDLATTTFDIQENFFRQQLMSVRLRCLVEYDPERAYTRNMEKSVLFVNFAARLSTSKIRMWHSQKLPTMQNIMVRLRKFCRNSFDAVPKLALRNGKIVVDMTVKVPGPMGVD